MKNKYIKLRGEFRKRYGSVDLDKFKGDVSNDMLKDAYKLFICLGEYKNHHKKNIRLRKYQSEWREKNKDKMRVYQRDYKRKARGTRPEMHKV